MSTEGFDDAVMLGAAVVAVLGVYHLGRIHGSQEMAHAVVLDPPASEVSR